jgi:hypothetical protein
MPKARRPEKAPVREAVEKKRDTLHRIEYHMQQDHSNVPPVQQVPWIEKRQIKN